MIVVISEQCAIDAGNAVHLARVCRASDEDTNRRQQANALSQDPQQSSDDCEALYTLTTHQVTDSAHVKPILRQISWNGVPLTMVGGEPRLEERSSTMPFCAGQPIVADKCPQPAKMVAGSGHQYPRGSDGDCVYAGTASNVVMWTNCGCALRRTRTQCSQGALQHTTTNTNETSPMPAGMADPTPAGSPPSSQPEVPPPLRRSKRLRRPPQRFNW
ncbi:hypothetical protein MRX96_030483 [Rhipicephalus microplus]